MMDITTNIDDHVSVLSTTSDADSEVAGMGVWQTQLCFIQCTVSKDSTVRINTTNPLVTGGEDNSKPDSTVRRFIQERLQKREHPSKDY